MALRPAALTLLLGIALASAMACSDGARIAYLFSDESASIYYGGSAQLHTMAADGSDGQMMSVAAIVVAPPAWTPDGRRIAYVGHDNRSELAIYVVDADGGNPLRFTGIMSGPAWSPDGQHLTFAKKEESAVALYVFASDGSKGRRVTTIPDWLPHSRNGDLIKAWVSTLAWSPDGTKILILANKYAGSRRFRATGAETMFVVGADGTELTRVSGLRPQSRREADLAYRYRYPAADPLAVGWSLDGLKIAVLACSLDELNLDDPLSGIVLYTMAPDGTDIRIQIGRLGDGEFESPGSS